MPEATLAWIVVIFMAIYLLQSFIDWRLRRLHREEQDRIREMMASALDRLETVENMCGMAHARVSLIDSMTGFDSMDKIRHPGVIEMIDREMCEKYGVTEE